MITPSPIPISALEPVSAGRAAATDQPPAVLGIPFAATTEAELLSAVEHAVERGEPTVFVGLYAALFRASNRDPRYRRLLLRSRVYPDGHAVSRELNRRGHADAERVATTDAIHPITELAAQRRWRIGLYGGEPGVAERAADRLRREHPGAEIVAVWAGFGRSPSARQLRDARLDILLVGLGAGQQEHYAHTVAVAAGVPATLTCGGLFDFLSGDARRAPRWMQRAGLEWLFRVLLDPRRMFVRYLLGNAYFLSAVAAERRIVPELRPEPDTTPAPVRRAA